MYKEMAEAALHEYLILRELPQKTIYEAMDYSLSAGGKRIRPVLTLAACEACGGRAEDALPFACAIEMIHTYSLIHDDLPCMDNDDFRRGKPTSHKKFGEATAVLAGDGLLTLAFETAAKAEIPPERTVRIIRMLANCAGADGMIGGQIVDMESEGKNISEETLLYLDRHKTGALLRASVLAGAMAAGADEEQTKALSAYAEFLGLAFQIRDDILDVTANEEQLGKPIGSDAEQGKTTYVSVYGQKRAEELAKEYTDRAIREISRLEQHDFFVALAEKLMWRQS